MFESGYNVVIHRAFFRTQFAEQVLSSPSLKITSSASDPSDLPSFLFLSTEVGESSGAKPSEEFWAKLVPSDSRYLDVQISSDEIVLCSEILFSSIRKCKWCKITRNSDHSSATIQN
ncbi:hypothetical protein DVH24_041605 [Malus domestica]|uniref:Uncharacterized protein n=1 Tax=Malus domestica TaxID=3750 RepID=A0A498IRY7_MALDO|nr:hypothetical protein DVH24_041605 [Malus domestica]